MKKQLSIWERRVPTLLAFIILIIGVGITTVFMKTTGFLNFGGNANATLEPKDVRISNITDSSLTVSYTTSGSVFGSVNYGKDSSMGNLALDERDEQQGSPANHLVHYITLRHLSANTTYYFSILSGGNIYLHNNAAFTAKTGTKIKDSPPKLTPLAGRITTGSNTNPNEALIYATSNNAQVISALVKPDGSYILPLIGLRNTSLNAYATPSASDIFTLFATDGHDSSTAKLSQTASDIPTIALSQNYDFTKTSITVGMFTASSSANFPSLSASTPTSITTQNVSITSPTQNQQFIDMQPMFKGTAGSFTPVSLAIDQNPQVKINTDNAGNWSYRPNTPLTQGSHTITISAKDGSGTQNTASQTFSILPSGSQVTESATGSGTITPTAPSPTPTLVPTATPTMAVTPTPTTTPTNTPTPMPTQAPVPTLSQPSPVISNGPTGGVLPTISTAPTPPVTGSSVVMVAGIAGTTLILFGILFFLLSRAII